MSAFKIIKLASSSSKSCGLFFFMLSLVVWTVLVTVALAVAYGEIRLPFNLANPESLISCFVILWLLGLLSLWAIRQRFAFDSNCRNIINRQVMKAKKEWEATFDAMPNPIAIIDKNYIMRRVNRAMADKLGMQVEECIGKKCYKYVHGTNGPPSGCPQVKMMKDGKIASSEMHEKKLDGDFVISAAPLYEDGVLNGSVHFFYDITQRKKAQEKLQRNEAFNRSILEAVGEGVYGLDMQGDLVFINHAACSLLGYSEEDILGQNFHAMIHYQRPDGSKCPADKCRVLEAMRRNAVVKVREDIFWRKDGSGFPVKYTAAPIFEQDKVTGSVVVFDDITEVKKAENERLALTGYHERRKRSRSLNVLAGGIAHNFNNILMAVSGNIELLLYSLPEFCHREREYANAAMDASRRAADFSTMMLWYVGQGNIKWQVRDMCDLVKEVEGQIRSDDLQMCTIKCGTCLEPLLFEGDETLVRQVIINLVKNSAEAMSEKPDVIELKSGCRSVAENELGGPYMDGNLVAGDYVYLEVIDHGMGMTEDAMEYIFEPFYTTKFTGRGLGLPFILGIMRSHHGAVVMKSELGKGTTATILFPALESLKPATVSQTEEILPESSAGEYQGTVLFVDDEKALRECNGVMLQLLGLQVLTAKNGPEALKIYSQHHDSISLVLLDIGLPGMDGFEVLTRLRKINPAVKVIIHTGYPEGTVMDKIAAHDIVGYLQEPFSLDDLRGVLDKSIGR